MPLVIDAEQVSRFYCLLHGNAGQETEIRCIHPDRTKPTFNYWGSLEEPQYADALADHNRDGYGIYLVVNQPDQARGKARVHDQRKGIQDEDVEKVTALFVEMDEEDEFCENMEKLQEAALPPSLLVRSSTEEKLHAYWLVADCPPELFTPLQAQLIALFGSDPTCKNLSRVMRIPGFWHTKREPIRSEILEAEGHTYTLAELCEAFELDPSLKLSERTVAQLPDDWTPPDDIQERILKAAERHAAKISPTGPGRHKTLNWFALACKENRLEQSVAENLVTRVLPLLPTREGGETVPLEEAIDVIEWVYAKANAGQPWISKKKKGNLVTVGGGGDPPDDDPFTEAPASVDVTIHKNGYATEKEKRVGKEVETYFEQLTNWTFTPTLTLIYPGGLRGERGTLAINGNRKHTIDLPSKAWNSRRDILEIVGGYGGYCFTNSASDIAKIGQFIDLAYRDLPSATGVQSYGLHFHAGEWIELFENATIGNFQTPPLFYAGTPVDPNSVAHAAPRIGTTAEYEKARDAIPRLQNLTTRTTALAVTGYAIASVFAPRILAYQGGKMPFLYTTGERESGKSTFIEINLEMVMGSKSGRFKLAPGMSTYQYDVAFSRANNFLAVLDEFKPNMIDDELLRKHHHLDTKWRGSGVAAKDHAYPLDAPLIVAGEGFTEDPASLSRGALYFFEKKDRGKLEYYNYLTQVPWFAFAPYLHELVRTLSEDDHRDRIQRADNLSRQAAAALNPRLVFALRFIAYGLLVLQDDLGKEYYSDATIVATLKQGAQNTLSGGEEGITNFEMFLQQLGSVASQAKDPESMFTPCSMTGDAIIRISNAVEAVKDRYRERAAISNSRMFRKLAHGAPFYVEGDAHKDFRGNSVRGLRISLAAIPERCDASALEYLEQKIRSEQR